MADQSLTQNSKLITHNWSAATKVRIEESPPAIAADAAELFTELAQRAAAEGGTFRVALSGGSTPRLLYGLLASDAFRGDVPWDRIQFFFGDERWVPHTHRDSNYKLANDELFSKLDLHSGQVFPMPTGSANPDEAAANYEASLRKAFGTKEGEVPRFDLIFLGMGDDGHTASLFPHTTAITEAKKLVAAPYVDKLGSHRITLSPPVLNAGKEVVFLVTGDTKADALKQVLEGEYNPEEYPSQLLRNAQGNVTWFIDRPAAAKLTSERGNAET
jgi:6-phosphogluconolactonase